MTQSKCPACGCEQFYVKDPDEAARYATRPGKWDLLLEIKELWEFHGENQCPIR